MLQPSYLIQFLIIKVLPYRLNYLLNSLKKLAYLKPTLACQTKANKKNNTGIIGITSARGPNTAKTPGNLLNSIVSI